ncbi:uncharacterized protein BCR38DRAFT_333831, partial [Pseudomassariella vexata]
RRDPPADYQPPAFPSLTWPPWEGPFIYSIYHSWRFTLLWTLILYAIFHLGAASIALFMQIGKGRSTWKYLLAVPVVYAITAGVEALFAGSIVGVILGAVYHNGEFLMSTWIPFVWAWINVLVLVVSSFSIQGGL